MTYGGGGETWTHTGVNSRRILSPVRLPIPPHPHKRGYSDIGRTQKDRRYYTDLMFITSRARTFKQLYLQITVQLTIYCFHYTITNIQMVAEVGFEPTTFRLWAWRADQTAPLRNI